MTIIIHDSGQERKRNLYVQPGSHTSPMDDGGRTGKHTDLARQIHATIAGSSPDGTRSSGKFEAQSRATAR